MALDWDGTSLLVCDSGNHRVVRWPKDAQQGEVRGRDSAGKLQVSEGGTKRPTAGWGSSP